MFIAWTLFPLGILLARFTRHLEPSTGPNARWFLLHRIPQVRRGCGGGLSSRLSGHLFGETSIHFQASGLLLLQSSGTALLVAGFGIGIASSLSNKHFVTAHGALGLAVVLCVFFQVGIRERERDNDDDKTCGVTFHCGHLFADRVGSLSPA